VSQIYDILSPWRGDQAGRNGQGGPEIMARISPTEEQLVSFHRAFVAAGLSETDTGAFKDVSGDWRVDPEENRMVATESTTADWIASRGKPAELRGDLLVFEDRIPGRKPGLMVTRKVYVLPTEFGTVAIVND
jgi:hypothetical protein